MLRELGYTVGNDEAPPEYAPPGEPQPDGYPDGYGEGYAEAPAPEHTGPSYDPSAPLPSYDLEEVSADEAMARRPHRGFAPSQLDDPFGEAPLPSFDLDDEATRYAQRGAVRDSTEIAVPPAPASSEGDSRPPFQASPAAGPTGPMGVVMPKPAPRVERDVAGQLDEEALEEVEFFVSNSMFDEARNVLEEQLVRLPNHPLLLERLRELEEHAVAQGGGSGTRAVPRSSSPEATAGPVSYNAEDRSFDIAASLDALDALDAGPQESHPQADPNDVSVEAVFEKFKAGVAAQISESDAATHYDLGAAYKEMGLVTDAIAEFELAGRDPGRECVCQWMVGMIHREQGNLEAAIHDLIRGLKAQVKTPDQELALTYEIGDCYEERRSTDQALYYFQRVARINPGYADMRGSAAERVRRLEPMPTPRAAAMAVGAESVDEFDAVLDDMLGGGKLP
jgi:tetratricopeptide (TPR) repeat protein